MLAYYQMEICISLRQFDLTIYKGIVFLLSMNISSKSLHAHLLVHFVQKYSKILHPCLLPIEDLYIVTAIWSSHFEGVISLFHLEYFISKLVGSTPCAFNIVMPQNFACSITTSWRYAYCYSNLIRLFLTELLPFLSQNIIH